MAERTSIIGSTTATGAPTWRDDELQAFEKHFLEEGVISGLAVSQYSGGANMSVDIAAGHALVQITNTNLAAGETYLVYFRNTAVKTVAVPTADATNPRIDRIVISMDVGDGSTGSNNPNAAASNIGVIELIEGTPASSPSAPAEPSNAITLALISVPASDTTISTGQITDSRTYVTLDSAVLADIQREATAVTTTRLKFADFTELTIASGVITVTQPLHTVDTESDAASDDLATITAAYGAGEIVHIRAENTARTVVLKHGTGNIRTADGEDFSLDDTDKSITLIYDGTNWYELARAYQPEASGKATLAGSQTSTQGGDTIGNTGTAANFASSATIAAGALQTGSEIEVFASGYMTTAGSNTNILITYRLGSTDVLTTGTVAMPTGMGADTVWEIRGRITVRSAGASGTLMASGVFHLTVQEDNFKMVTDTTGVPDPITSFDTTGALVAVPRIDWTTADASNTITMMQHTVKVTIL